jgi:hypothetical protein
MLIHSLKLLGSVKLRPMSSVISDGHMRISIGSNATGA